MKPVLRLKSLFTLFFLSACFGPISTPSGSVSSESTERQLIFNFGNKDDIGTDMPRVLVPGLEVEIIAGNGKEGYKDGPALEAEFYTPLNVVLTDKGTLLISDANNERIRELNKEGVITTVAGSGQEGIKTDSALESEFSFPSEILKRSKHSFLILNISGEIYELNTLRKTITLFAAVSGQTQSLDPDTITLKYSPKCLEKYQEKLDLCMNQAIYRQNEKGLFEPFIGQPGGFVRSPSGSLDIDGAFRHYQDGSRKEALFSNRMNLAFVPNGDIYIADGLNHMIRKYDAATEMVSTVTGSPVPGQALIATSLESGYRDGVLTEAEINHPGDIIHHDSGVFLFESKGRLRLMSETHVSTLIDQVALSLELSDSKTLYGSDSRGYIYRITLDMPTILAYLKEHPITFTSPEPPYQEFVESESV